MWFHKLDIFYLLQLVTIVIFSVKMAPNAKRRKLTASTVEEVSWDPTARQEYLTGFHKRKVQRTKHAQEAAGRRARAERIDDRKKVRRRCFRVYGSRY